ncbi:MAG: DUF3291 domain-containing protein [Pseudomonadota bacterium]
MASHFLAHFNVARPLGKFSVHMDESKYFFDQLGKLFKRDQLHQGLLWHRHGMRASDGRELSFFEIAALDTEGAGNPHIYTLAGWKNAAAVHGFTYRDAQHVESMRRLRHWVDRSEGANMVMWWAEQDTRISLEMAWDRLARLREDGPTPQAFNLQSRFQAPTLSRVA